MSNVWILFETDLPDKNTILFSSHNIMISTTKSIIVYKDKALQQEMFDIFVMLIKAWSIL